ncbi:zinc carboxypeptidase [Pseudoflavitalea sp. G-6-1-2]|uniref:M14 metallopeptidase family protein n=1 Tax=Pseudoflavitalea sp. G-6-1-2 TaxID=2728841 RepID=UPI00146EC9B4|nr:M14 metallopeptidase family protein [Pseudoflavitalea sp. G-6-1-2]NML22126.1 zinc carboxypeptidase [Pseudoflavitalea sp. G-6-1-2]
MKKIYVTWLLLLISTMLFAQVQSPEQFLGYKIGSRYTPHFNVVNYCKYLGTAAPNMVKVEQYGTTNEGRPLLLVFVASPENAQRLDAIRLNNLRLAGATRDKAASDENAPAIVWLSYNVHGNETSSSEAAMLTLFELVNPANSKTKEYLKNTVVVVDPCMNPDGRDRYVNWFNSVVGKNANPVNFTREHSEPWPGGRPNHYYFDLNRDWAWQTQVESQQRMARYNQWLPQVHVDFHEQGVNEPYYFAPAAEPFHEVITPWQRDFQVMIGRSNAKYFDQNGWLFFTKERFDLFYPSYGDTYPIYKGAIGMTYEQGGHSRGGAAVINEDGDTLTLYDRLIHHFTTGMSTIETSASNASRLVKEFKKYYDKARTAPPGEFKAWLIKADGGDRLKRLTQLLDKNNIEYSYLSSGSANGLNYFTNKNESVKITPGDVVINAGQTNANLLKVLFERTSKLSDSATYDITAWSMPYAYGLTTYGLNATLGGGSAEPPVPLKTTVAPGSTITAYAIKWTGLGSVRFLAELIKRKVKVRYAEQPFVTGGEQFEKGTLIVTKTSNTNVQAPLESIIQEVSKTTGEAYYPVASGYVDRGYDFGSDKVRIIRAPRVTLLAGDGISSLGMGEVWHYFDHVINYPLNVVWIKDFGKDVLKETDVLIMPDGNYRSFDKNMHDALKDWVSNGGRIVAIEGGVGTLARNEWGIKLKESDDKKDDKKEDKKDDYTLLRKYENRERDYLPSFIPGAIYKVDLDNSHPLAFGYDSTYYTLKQDDNIYDFFKEGMGWNVGVIKKSSQISGFVGSKLKDRLKDGLLFGVQNQGDGTIVYFTDNPVFRSFWENGKLLFANAVFMVGQ